MTAPRFSVIIPAYRYGRFVGQAVQSVLDQTCTDLEVIVVDDASPDDTAEVVQQFADPRVQYIAHPRNRGLPAARNTGMRAARGDYIALLDADDTFHPRKLEAHQAYLQAHPEAGVTYNPRFELEHGGESIRALYRPPLRAGLEQFVFAFPFAPSDMVIRRTWLERSGLFDEALVNGAEDMDYPCRLALDGCQFHSVDHALNYRRYHIKRVHRNLPQRKREYELVLNRIFDDPRLPAELKPLRRRAIAEHNLYSGFLALAQQDTAFGQELLRESAAHIPGFISGSPSPLAAFLLDCSLNHGEPDYARLLRSIFDQLPPDMMELPDVQYAWTVRQGHLLSGIRDVIWDRPDAGRSALALGWRAGAKADEVLLERVAGQLWDIEMVLGEQAAQKAMERLALALRGDQPALLNRLRSRLLVNQSFYCFQQECYAQVPGRLLRAAAHNPRLGLNRGVLAVFLRSLLHAARTPPKQGSGPR